MTAPKLDHTKLLGFKLIARDSTDPRVAVVVKLGIKQGEKAGGKEF